MRVLFLTGAIYFLVALSAAAESTDKKSLPATGRLAGSSVSGYGHTGFEGAWGGENLSGENSSPISASISRTSAQKWLVSVFNNSEDSYKVQLNVQQYNDASKRLKSNPISTTLEAGENFERPLSAHVLATHASVDLTRWTRIEKTLSREELNTLIAEKKDELKALEAQLANLGAE